MAATTDKQRAVNALPVIGWREWLALPQLDIRHIQAKVDTGARTSALHAVEIECGAGDDGDEVRFVVQPQQGEFDPSFRCRAPVIDQRRVINSGGQSERRPVILSSVTLGPHTWDIEITLTSRETLRYRMLLGRLAVRNRFVVNPGRSCLIGTPPPHSTMA